MATPIRYQFSSTGEETVVAAFKSVAAAARDAQKATGATRRGAERAAVQASARAASDSGKAAEASALRSARATARAEAQRWREVERTSAKIQAEFAKEARAAERAAAARARADRRVADARLRTLGTLAKDAALGFGAGAIGVGAGLVGAAARQSLALGDRATRVSIAGRSAGGEFVAPDVLRREFERVAVTTPGVKSEDVANAVEAFVAKTGRLDVARGNLSTFATVASASGADIKDVAQAAADLFEKFDIKSVDDMQLAFAALTEQGKQGSFELKDAASQFARLSAAASRFGLDKGAGGVATLGGLTQIARSATGSPEQAATAVEATLRQLVTKSADIKRITGTDVFADKTRTRTRNVEDVLVGTISGAKGDLTKLQGIFGEEGIRAISPLISTFNEAAAAVGKDASERDRLAAGTAALRAKLDGAIRTTEGWTGIQRDAAQAQSSTSSKVTQAWETLVAKVTDQVTPHLESLAGKLVEMEGPLDALAGTAGVIAEGFSALFDLLASIPGLGDAFKRKPDVDREIKKKQEEIDKIDREIAKDVVAGVAVTADDPRAKRAEQLAADAKALEDSKFTTDETRVRTEEEHKAELVAAASDQNVLLGGAASIALPLVGALGAANQIATGGLNEDQRAIEARQKQNIARQRAERGEVEAPTVNVDALQAAVDAASRAISALGSRQGFIVPQG